MPDAVEIRDIEHLHWRLADAESPLTFSTNGHGLSLVAAVELACIAAHRETEKDDPRLTLRVPNCAAWSLVKAARWPERSHRARLRDADLAVVVLPRCGNDPWWSQCIRDLLTELKGNGFPPKLAGALTGAVAEMADNVWLHSNAHSPGLVAYQIRRRRFAFSVADVGVGVLASLRENPRYRQLSSSMEALRAAIEPGVSRFGDSGGMGFPSLLHALADLWGTARIRSGEAGLLLDRRRDRRRKQLVYLPNLPGVHVSARCSLEAPGGNQ
ncbi:MAG TPA: hypothetical protein VMF66_03825 [Candidatus Acidoferrum sp.]|nr:hypothetical protein [Candidatus Acidoferrum sp.]